MKAHGMLRFSGCLAAAFCAAALQARQIDLRLQLADTVYVVGEPVRIRVSAENGMRETLRINRPGGPDRFFFEVTSSDPNDLLAPSPGAPAPAAFDLPLGQTVSRLVELDKYFPLLTERKYFVRGVVLHRGVRYESQKKSFDVVPGIPVRKGLQMFVKPADRKRTFTLVYWFRNEVDRIFLRTGDEPGGKVWDTVDLGNFLRSAPPKLDIAPDGVVTVTHRADQNTFIRTVLWSLPDSLEVVERNTLLDPEISASQRVKSLYGEAAGGKKEEKKPWWKFW